MKVLTGCPWWDLNHLGIEKMLQTHLGWRREILKKRENENRDFFVITPEFGPLPYMWSDPLNGEPIAKHTEINLIMKQIIEDTILTKKETK